MSAHDSVPDRPFRILAVCTANICRSPMVEMVLRAHLPKSGFEVASAGVHGFVDRPMDSMSAMELMRLGEDPLEFRSQPVTPELVVWADVVLTATRDHRASIVDLVPAALRKTFTLLEFADVADKVEAATLTELVAHASTNRALAPRDTDIADPYGRTPDVHRAVAVAIAGAAQRVSARLTAMSQDLGHHQPPKGLGVV